MGGTRGNRRRFGVAPSVRAAVALGVLLVLATLLVAPGSAPTTRLSPAPGTQALAEVGPSPYAVHWGRSVSPGSATAQSPSTPPFSRPLSNSSCSALPGGLVVGEFGLNLTVLSTPSNNSGPAPVNFSWILQVNGSGLPPYSVEVIVMSAASEFVSTNFSGNDSLARAGIYEVSVEAWDSTCTQVAATYFSVQAWGSIGPHPVQVTASTNASTVPANITYTVNTTGLPIGWTLFWANVGFYPYQGVENFTYYLPGVYNATACFVQPDGVDYACATSPNVTVSGPSVVATNITIAPGPYPTNVTFWANLTHPAILPNGTQLYLYAWNGTAGVWNYSSNSTIRLTEQAGCGFPWNSEIAPTGNCTFSAHFSLLGSGAQPDGGHLGSLVLYFNLTANGTPSTWYPTVTYSYGPLTGSAPLNLSLNLSAAHGVAPYYYDYLVLGRSSGAPSATAFGPYYRVGYGWNGSAVSFVIPLNATGYYWGTVFIADTANNWVSDALPLINLGNVTIPAPLRVDATETNATVPSPGRGAGVAFEASTLGGRGPFEVQWQFGDGAFASSLPGQSIQHVYTVSGTYQPTVTITDALGHAVVTTLPTVTVTVTAPPTHSTPPKGTEPPPSPTVGSAPSPSIAWTQVAGAAGVAIALVVLGALLVRREVGREGEELVAGLTPTGPPPGPSEPPK